MSRIISYLQTEALAVIKELTMILSERAHNFVLTLILHSGQIIRGIHIVKAKSVRANVVDDVRQIAFPKRTKPSIRRTWRVSIIKQC